MGGFVYGCAQEPYVKPREFVPPKRVEAMGSGAEIVQAEGSSYLVVSKAKTAAWKKMLQALRRP